MNASRFIAGAEVTRAARPSRSAVPAMRTQATANPIPFVDEQRARSSEKMEPTSRTGSLSLAFVPTLS